MKWNFKKLEKNEKIKGIYLGQYRDIGAFKKKVHEILPSGEKQRVHIWGSVALNYALYGVVFGSLIEITYLGKGHTPETKHEVHLYDVVVIEPAKTIKAVKKKKKK